MDRRDFFKTGTAATVSMALSNTLTASAAEVKTKDGDSDMIWAILYHLGYNMWCDWDNPKRRSWHTNASPDLRFDDSLWNDLVKQMAEAGVNMVVIDIGEGVRYESHPELAVNGSWTPDRLKKELANLRELGIEPIPKLNFSATHDAWLGPYSRCLSTPAYYDVCKDLIAETIQLFDTPRFFHLGMDEETAPHQRDYEYVVIRQHDLWWRDFYFYIEQVQAAGVRPWIWSDYVWHHPEDFYKKMPKSVLQSNWYYGEEFDVNDEKRYVKAYVELEEHGYDQVPTGSNWSNDVNFQRTVDFCKKHIAPELLKGFLHAPWRPTLEQYREHSLNAIRQTAAAMG